MICTCHGIHLSVTSARNGGQQVIATSPSASTSIDLSFSLSFFLPPFLSICLTTIAADPLQWRWLPDTSEAGSSDRTESACIEGAWSRAQLPVRLSFTGAKARTRIQFTMEGTF